jgi:RHS repeat-associated protein
MNHHYPVYQLTNTNPFRLGVQRYGFNGMERDNERLGGGGSTYDFGSRIYNQSLGRFLSLDILLSKYPGTSPFTYAINHPIIAIDKHGKGPYFVIYSPEQAQKIKTALDNQDYDEVLRILRFGSENAFVDQSGNPSNFIASIAGRDVMPVENQGIIKASRTDVWRFELYSLDNDGTYSSEDLYVQIPIQKLSPNLVGGAEGNWWDSWDSQTEAKYQKWLQEQINEGGEFIDKDYTNNDEATKRALFDMGILPQDLPSSALYSNSISVNGHPTPEFNGQLNQIQPGQEFFVPGAHGGAFKYHMGENGTPVPSMEYSDPDGNSTNWTTDPSAWEGVPVVPGK